MSEFSLRDRRVEVKSEARVDNILSGWKIFRQVGKLLSGREILCQVRMYSVGLGIILSVQRYWELND